MASRYPEHTPDMLWLKAELARLRAGIADANRRAMVGGGLAAGSGGTGTGGGDNSYSQSFAAAATWTIAVPAAFGRTPNVAIFSPGGEEVEADVTASSTIVTVQFPAPYAGSVLLT